MKVAFVLAAIGKKRGKPYVRTWQIMEPLTIAMLKALTPPEVETEFYDDRLELVDYESQADLVAITTEVYTARRAYQIAGRFRDRGKTVVLGGYHATLNPDEAAQHCDTVVCGNAEGVWPRVLQDFQGGVLAGRYQGGPLFKDVLPDRSLFRDKGYSALGVVETGRGCRFQCEFCAISAYYKGCYSQRSVEAVVRDVRISREAGKKIFFFADDNIVAEPEFAIELFKALTPLKIRWSGQGSLTMARNPELLYWMRKSGCQLILIGYESLEEKNLNQMNKGWAVRLGEARQLTRTIHAAGLGIYATFLFGFDHDTRELYERTLAFAQEMQFFCVAFNHLLPMPGTPLHKRLSAEGRLLDEQWWLTAGYRYGQIVFQPRGFTPQQVSVLCKRTRNRFYTAWSILRRSLYALKRGRDIPMFLYYWYVNIRLGLEVDQKYGITLGDNLDELPK